jgi:diguanylate cyclase (GGDEF)-like protein
MNFKILVIDDEMMLREMLKDIFSIAGYDVITAENGKEGLQKIEAEMPDFVILDGSMPVMDGFETLKEIRKNPRFINLPVMMFTALSGETEQIKGLNLGADDYITKPFKTTVLLSKVKNILERKKQSIDVNPLTGLPGNLTIQHTVEKHIVSKDSFSLLYIDLSNFKSFNDKYGFYRGDEVIKFTASLLTNMTKEYGNVSDFVGHVGGDDFIIISSIDNSIKIAENIIEKFDYEIKRFYDANDLKQGFIVTTDRKDNIKQIPIMTISISIIDTNIACLSHYAEISKRAAELKKEIKKQNKSAFIFERRKFCR